MSLARRPAFHFIVIGVLLFLFERQQRPPATLSLSVARVEQLRADLVRQTGTSASPDQEAALVAHELDQEILYREALARALDRSDPSIRYRLVEKMRFLSEGGEERRDDETLYRQALALGLDRDDAIVRRALIEKMRLIARHALPQSAPSTAALQDYLERHADQYRQPPRVRFSQVFLSSAQRGAGAAHDAEVLLDRLQSATPPALEGLSDAMPVALGHSFMSARDIEKLLGPEFTRQVMALDPGSWTGPIVSPFGVHLVRIDERDPGQLPSLAAVRQQVEQAFRVEQGEHSYAEFIRQLRVTYRVEHTMAVPRVSSRGNG